MINVKRVTDPVEKNDGHRVLIDRLWPRGMKKSDVKYELWLKEVSPSTTLRQWFSHDPAKWNEFRRRFWQELDANPDPIQKLIELAKNENVTLVFGSKERQFNNATALKEYLEKNLGSNQARGVESPASA